MVAQDQTDDQQRRGQERAHRAPHPGPEHQRQENRERIDFEPAADNRRRDELALERRRRAGTARRAAGPSTRVAPITTPTAAKTAIMAIGPMIGMKLRVAASVPNPTGRGSPVKSEIKAAAKPTPRLMQVTVKRYVASNASVSLRI